MKNMKIMKYKIRGQPTIKLKKNSNTPEASFEF